MVPMSEENAICAKLLRRDELFGDKRDAFAVCETVADLPTELQTPLNKEHYRKKEKEKEKLKMEVDGGDEVEILNGRANSNSTSNTNSNSNSAKRAEATESKTDNIEILHNGDSSPAKN